MPSIPGLEEWVQKFPGLVHYSKQYRRPEAYANQSVLIVGAICEATNRFRLTLTIEWSRLVGQGSQSPDRKSLLVLPDKTRNIAAACCNLTLEPDTGTYQGGCP